MRLTVSLVASLALHTILLGLSPTNLIAPELMVSNNRQTVALQIHPLQPPKKPVPLPSKEDPKSIRDKPPPMPRKIIKKANSAPPTVPSRKPPQPEKVETYVSKAPKAPRLVERAEYLNNPPPEYPKQARRRRYQGSTTLLVEIDSLGRVTTIGIQQSSGHSILDQAAKQAVFKWRFTPAMLDNTGVPSTVLVPVMFRLGRE